jgi:site-specific DNA-cytosine methylase
MANILVLFDGAGLARKGLEAAGHTCVGIELDPVAHYLSQFVGNPYALIHADVTDPALRGLYFWADAVWASPPCQWLSAARTQGEPVSEFSQNLLEWSLNLPKHYPHLQAVWVENVLQYGKGLNGWGTVWNAAQFKGARQNRNRVVGGEYPAPAVEHEYRKAFKGMCPCVTATEYKGCGSDTRRASRFYGRRLTLEECAYHMGLSKVPAGWEVVPEWFEGTPGQWKQALYRALGNGVPVWMAKAFGEALQA